MRHRLIVKLPSLAALRWGMAVVLIVATSGTSGCAQKGPARYELTGKVTYRGQAVPKGFILFAPDRSKGNKGPGSRAIIVNGTYEMLPGQGMVGGPHKVTVVGTDGVPFKQEDGVMNPLGRPVFPEYEVQVDLPTESGNYDFEVPEKKS